MERPNPWARTGPKKALILEAEPVSDQEARRQILAFGKGHNPDYIPADREHLHPGAGGGNQRMDLIPEGQSIIEIQQEQLGDVAEEVVDRHVHKPGGPRLESGYVWPPQPVELVEGGEIEEDEWEEVTSTATVGPVQSNAIVAAPPKRMGRPKGSKNKR
jgi:hypothetical protein